jgi:glucose uptake protein GlcU
MTAVTAPATTTRDSFLRFALRLDAVGSGLVGVVGLAIAPQLAKLSGTTITFEYAVGALFVAYSVALLVLSRRPSVRQLGRVCAIGNLVFTAAAVIVVLAGVFPLTTAGVVGFLGSAVFTLAMADLQYLGLRRIRA